MAGAITNQSEYNRKLFQFIVTWIITTGCIVFFIIHSKSISCQVNENLERRVHELEQIERKREIIMATFDAVDETANSLKKSYDENKIRKLRKYPNEDFGDVSMMKKLNVMCNNIADLVSSTKESERDIKNILKIKKAEIEFLEKQVNSTQNLNSNTIQ